MAGCGCGCCACLHVLIELDKYKNWTPKDLRPYMVKSGFAIKGQGTLWSGITKTLQHYGFSVINHPNMSSVWKTLGERKSKLGVILFRGGSRGGVTWTTGGHFVAFVDYKVANGKHYFYCKDSGGRHHDGWYCYETTMQGLIPQIWTANPPSGEKLVGKTSTNTSASAKPATGKLTVDGKFGPASIMALQKKLGTPQDGKISGQLSSLKQYHGGFSSGISYGSGGSACIVALQKLLKLSGPDGQLGPNTIKALQKYLGLSGPDGYWGPNTSKAVQKWLNGDLKPSSGSTSTPSTVSTTPAAATPKKSVYKVIDVSAWQGNIDWKKVKADGVDGAIIRYADGLSTLDSKFDTNMNNAIAAGLHVGCYIFSRAKSKSEAEKEAVALYNAVKKYGKRVDMPLYIDLEWSSAAKYADTVATAYVNKMKALGGRPGIYANLNWFNNYLTTKNYLSYPLWLAQYNSKITHKHPEWFGMWQYSSSGSVKGISGRVDMDKCYVAYWK